jgi:hypothetical protein
MQTFKQRCVSLRKSDHSLLEIARITGRSKTSVYFHIQGIPLSDHKRKTIRRLATRRVVSAAQKRKGKSVRTFTRFDSWSKDTVHLVAHLMFDGEISHTGCMYNNRSTALIQSVERAMRSMYAYKPSRYLNTLTGVHRISYFNVELCSYMQSKAALLTREIAHLPESYQRTFLRAFFDDEGCMDYRIASNRRSVRGYQKDSSVLYLIEKLLRNFSIAADIKGGNEIRIVGKANLVAFQKHINFSRGVRINGARSNSLWCESLQKRELLTRAIRSFKAKTNAT